MINLDAHIQKFSNFWDTEPFPHAVIENFWDTDFALDVYKELPNPDSDLWNGHYDNPIEFKKTLNIWDRFDSKIYQAFIYLCSKKFSNYLSDAMGIPDLIPDVGLHGGGLHYYPQGGKLNPHIDYAHHPKLLYRRKLNLLVYLNHDWHESHGGHLGLWSKQKAMNHADPDRLVRPTFNSCIIFENSLKSYHGLATPCTRGRYSMAMYYLINDKSHIQHTKAKFLPTKNQKDDPKIHKLIDLRKQRRVNSDSGA